MSISTALRSKRGLIQLAVAVLVAGVCAVASIATVYSIFVGFASTQEQSRKQADKQVKQLQEQLEQVRLASAQQADKGLVTQVQATEDIALGQPIRREQVVLVDVPKTQALTTSLHSLTDVLGRTAIAPITGGTFVTAMAVSQVSNAGNVPQGFRAVSVSVDSVGGIAGSVMPGSTVDVMVTATATPTATGAGAGTPQSVTKTVLQRVRVLEVARPGTNSQGNAAPVSAANTGGNSLVTLAVTPQQAEVLALAQQMGRFHLALRGYGDTALTRLPGSRWQQIISTGTTVRPKVRAYAPPPALPSFDELMRRQGASAGNVSALGPAMTAAPTGTPYQMEVVKGSNSEWVTLQSR